MWLPAARGEAGGPEGPRRPPSRGAAGHAPWAQPRLHPPPVPDRPRLGPAATGSISRTWSLQNCRVGDIAPHVTRGLALPLGAALWRSVQVRVYLRFVPRIARPCPRSGRAGEQAPGAWRLKRVSSGRLARAQAALIRSAKPCLSSAGSKLFAEGKDALALGLPRRWQFPVCSGSLVS